MQIILTLIILVLIYTAYQLNELAKQFKAEKINKVRPFSTLTPLFSEDEIDFYKQKQQQYQTQGDEAWDTMIELEKAEIQAHSAAGKDKKSFEPTEELEKAMAAALIAVLNRNNFRSYWRKMVESNIAILNGAEIGEAENQFYANKNLRMLSHMDFAYKHNPEVKKEYEEFVKGRAEYWRDSWDSITQDLT